jgi:AcrR family transcriptional regulator
MASGSDGAANRGAAAPPNGTATRLLEAALRTLARQGTDNFSMANIGREAGVSRRTLYRYFHNSDEVLQAVAVHVGDSYVRAVDDAIAKEPALDKRVEVLLHATIHYGDYHPAAVAVFRMEPAFTLQFLESTLDRYIDVVRGALEPAHGEVPALAEGTVTPEVFAEILIRLGISGFTMHSAGVELIASAFAKIAHAHTT